jgi:transcriptional regulator with PAS, ATPase and Fis domain
MYDLLNSIHETQERVREKFPKNPSLIFAVDQSFRIIAATQTTCQITQKKPTDLLGKKIELLIGKDAEQFQHELYSPMTATIQIEMQNQEDLEERGSLYRIPFHCYFIAIFLVDEVAKQKFANNQKKLQQIFSPSLDPKTVAQTKTRHIWYPQVEWDYTSKNFSSVLNSLIQETEERLLLLCSKNYEVVAINTLALQLLGYNKPNDVLLRPLSQFMTQHSLAELHASMTEEQPDKKLGTTYLSLKLINANTQLIQSNIQYARYYGDYYLLQGDASDPNSTRLSITVDSLEPHPNSPPSDRSATYSLSLEGKYGSPPQAARTAWASPHDSPESERTQKNHNLLQAPPSSFEKESLKASSNL